MFSDAAQTMTITEICNDHYLPEIRSRRKPNTVYGYESSINLHVLPRWGHLRVSDITRKDVQAWVDALAEECGPGGAKKAYKCLRQIIRWAIDEGLEAADPTRRIEIAEAARAAQHAHPAPPQEAHTRQRGARFRADARSPSRTRSAAQRELLPPLEAHRLAHRSRHH